MGRTHTEDLNEDLNGAGIHGTRAAFQAQTFPHVEAVYSDALCLTGSVEEAADLVVESYARAFGQYERFRRRHASSLPRERDTLAWLYWNMHAAFCGRTLTRANHTGVPAGDRP